MYAQTQAQVTEERSTRKRRFDDIQPRATAPSARGSAPKRAVFAKRKKRFVDDAGRVYVLPVKGDAKVERLAETGFIDEAYDGDNATLPSRTFMYAWRPSTARNPDSLRDERFPAMPSATDNLKMTLRECDRTHCALPGGQVYEAFVERVETKRRSARGQVIFRNVRQTHTR